MRVLLQSLLSSSPFMPHGHCYLWRTPLVALHVISDSLIGLAYLVISLTLVYLIFNIRRIRDIPFQWMYLAFGIFIIACGFTHFMEVVTVWTPAYWLAGALKAVTALASVGTAVLLPFLSRRAAALARSAQLAEERGLELEATNTELGGLYEKSRALERLKTQFFANVSHELRTPLALILGPAEKLLRGPGLTAEQRRDLEVVGRNARALLKHVNDLLDVSRLEAGKLEPAYVEADLARELRLAVALFESRVDEQGVTCAVEAPPSLPAQIDADQVQRVLLNLLSNAFKFTPAGGRVRCLLVADGQGRAVLEVADSGPGVPAAQREAIFERFRQGDEGPWRDRGTGLGLAIARDFVRLHGGELTVGDAPEGGALFRVELPLLAPAGTQVGPARPGGGAATWAGEPAGLSELPGPPEPPGLPQPIEDRPGQAGGEQAGPAPRMAMDHGALVLVVEDHPEMSRFVAEVLGKDHRTALAGDGREGLERALRLRPDLIVSDIMMPRMSGAGLVRAARARPELDGVPILLLSARADDELRVKLLSEGAQDYLIKPFTEGELRARATNLISTKRTRDLLQQELHTRDHDLLSLAEELTRRKRELQAALEAMRVACDHAERASQVKGHFLRLVSHELRTPLTAIQLQLEVLQRDREGSLSPRQREVLGKMFTSAARLLEMIESLLEYTRVESGSLETRVEPFDLAALAGDVVQELQRQMQGKRLALQLTAEPDLPPLRSDPRLVRLILVNLIGNAIKFTEQGGVLVGVELRGGAHVVTVTDTGKGIPREQLPEVFEPFQILEPMKNKHHPGVGLGLALVRELVQGLGGHIEVDSQVDQGSMFTVTLHQASV